MTKLFLTFAFCASLAMVPTSCVPEAEVEAAKEGPVPPRSTEAKAKNAFASDEAKHEVYYKQQEGRMLLIFNYDTMEYNVHDIDYLENPAQPFAEFGSSFSNCTNDEYYCLSVQMDIAVPRLAHGQLEWSVGGMNCIAEAPFNWDANIVQCEASRGITRFFYSIEEGVEWFEISDAPQDRFLSVYSKGLFARGSFSNFSDERKHK